MSIKRHAVTLRWQVEILLAQTKCARCNQQFTLRENGTVIGGVEWDHFIPLAMGGPDHPRNMCALHKRCHQDKTTGPVTKTSGRGTDITEIRRAERLAATQAEFRARLTTAGFEPPKSPSRWPKRKL